MRQIGSLSDSQKAQLFSDYLVTQGIAAHTEQDGEEWLVWVRDENQVETARTQLMEFRENSHDERYRDVTQVARRLREEDKLRRRQAARHTVDMRQQWHRPVYRRAPLTTTLIALSIGLSLYTGFGADWSSYGMRVLAFADLVPFMRTGDGMAQIRTGQVWRLVTPIFLHGGVIHLLFNLYWLYLFGTQIEARRGSLRLGGIVLAVAVVSNLLQFYLGQGPQFLGMSGVVYGLLGYIWIKQRFEPNSAYMLSQSTFTFLVAFMIVMFAFELVTGNPLGGLRVAHWAHLGGLVGGMVVAYLPIMLHSR